MLRLSLGSLLALALAGLASGGPAPSVLGARPLSDADLALVVGSDCPKAGFKASDAQRCSKNPTDCESELTGKSGIDIVFMGFEVHIGPGKIKSCSGYKEKSCNARDSYDDADNTARNKQIPNNTCGKYDKCLCDMGVTVFGTPYFQDSPHPLGSKLLAAIKEALGTFKCLARSDDASCNRYKNCGSPNTFTTIDPTCGF